jgi:hypothetical protein
MIHTSNTKSNDERASWKLEETRDVTEYRTVLYTDIAPFI